MKGGTFNSFTGRIDINSNCPRDICHLSKDYSMISSDLFEYYMYNIINILNSITLSLQGWNTMLMLRISSRDFLQRLNYDINGLIAECSSLFQSWMIFFMLWRNKLILYNEHILKILGKCWFKKPRRNTFRSWTHPSITISQGETSNIEFLVYCWCSGENVWWEVSPQLPHKHLKDPPNTCWLPLKPFIVRMLQFNRTKRNINWIWNLGNGSKYL